MASIRIDFREVPAGKRKNLIFSQFDDLGPDDHILLVVNHSANPLFKLFELERKGFFLWKYRLEGPPVWEIEISRKKLDYSIRELIELNPASIEVFEKYEIPYYLNTSLPLKDFLRNKGLNDQDIAREALSLTSYGFAILKPWLWSIRTLIEFIVGNHHNYVRSMIPCMKQFIQNLDAAHGNSYPMLQMLIPAFDEFSTEVLEHMDEEEHKVFPQFLKAAEHAEFNEEVAGSVNWMEEDHHVTIDSLKNIREICHNFNSPDDSVPGLTLLFNDLRLLEKDFHYHLLLEDHYLFRQVKKLVAP